MDLTQVVPAWLSGIAQELGAEHGEFKLVLRGDEGQFDPKPIPTLMETYDKLECEFALCDPHYNTEPHLEIRLKGDVPLMAPHSTSIASDVKLHGDIVV